MNFIAGASIFIVSCLSLTTTSFASSVIYNTNVTASGPSNFGYHHIEYSLPKFDASLGSLQGFRLYANGTDFFSGFWDITETPIPTFPGPIFDEYISIHPFYLSGTDVGDYGDFLDAIYVLKLHTTGFDTTQGAIYRLPQSGIRGRFTHKYTFSDDNYVSDKTHFREMTGSGNVASVQWDFSTNYPMEDDGPYSNYMYSHAFVTESWNMNFGIEYYYAVPEPATWAMLIVGFGLMGAAMRRRRAVARTEIAVTGRKTPKHLLASDRAWGVKASPAFYSLSTSHSREPSETPRLWLHNRRLIPNPMGCDSPRGIPKAAMI